MNRIFIIFSFFFLVNCNDKKNNSLKDNLPQNGNEHYKTTNNSNDTIKEDAKPNNAPTDDELVDLGFELMENEALNKLKLGLTTEQVEKILGPTTDVSIEEMWDADGEIHQTFYYKNKGVELDMIGNKGNKQINSITIIDPCDFKTTRDIGVGSSLSDLEKTYSVFYNKDFSNKETFVAGSIYGGIIFGLENDKVVSIFIGASAD